jgi:hypothetical protein
MTYLNKFMDACYAWNCDAGKFKTKFYTTFLTQQHFTHGTIPAEKQAVQHYTEP